jgi:hypothetical protein
MNMAQNQATQEQRNERTKAMQEQRDERTKANEEAMKRMDSSKPTPTQEENDLAKLGVMVDEKEDDGSGPTILTKTLVANEPLGPGGYETRSVRVKEAREKAEAKEREAREARAARQAKETQS